MNNYEIQYTCSHCKSHKTEIALIAGATPTAALIKFHELYPSVLASDVFQVINLSHTKANQFRQ